MKQAPDAIYIITVNPARAEEMKRAIVLRGFDEIVCVPVENAERLIQSNPPALALVDLEGDTEKLQQLMTQLSQTVKSLVLVEQFDEASFLACHDAGARDYMVKPVPDAYLVSKVIQTLQTHRLEQISSQKDRILVEMGVLSARSGIFTTSYLLKLLKQYSEPVSARSPEPLSLLLVELGGYESPLPDTFQNALMSDVGVILKDCSRGLDAVGEYFMDKCAVILPKTGKRGATALGKRIMQRLNGLAFQGPHGLLYLQSRIGVAEYAGCRHYEDLLNLALENLRGSEVQLSGKATPLHPV